jgi:hypothetical protein
MGITVVSYTLKDIRDEEVGSQCCHVCLTERIFCLSICMSVSLFDTNISSFRNNLKVQLVVFLSMFMQWMFFLSDFCLICKTFRPICFDHFVRAQANNFWASLIIIFSDWRTAQKFSFSTLNI